MTKFMKFSILIMSIFVVMFFGSMTQSVMAGDFTLDGVFSSADSWLSQGSEGESYTEGINQPIQTIASAIYGIGVTVLVIVTVVLGIKYITCNPDEQARIKGQLIGLVVSAVVLFGAVPLWRMIGTALSNSFGG